MLLIEKRKHQNNAPAKITRAENQTTRRGAREFAPSGNAEVDQETGEAPTSGFGLVSTNC
jgi:hypothetical protein